MRSVDDAVALVAAICARPVTDELIHATEMLGFDMWLRDAVGSRDTPALYDWLVESFSFQGIGDRVAWGFIEAHGNANWHVVEASLERTRCACPKLGSFDAYQRCGFRKGAGTCNEPTHLARCPVPSLPLRKGDLNQLAYSLYYFLRDECDDDLVGFIDRLFDAVDATSPEDPVAAKRSALLKALSQVHAVSHKLIGMTFAVMLMAGDPLREDWVAVGRSLLAIDSLVHNFLHRTGILSVYDHQHRYGDACYGKAGCTSVIYDLTKRIGARRSNTAPTIFPRLVEFAIWHFCAETRGNVCNGHRIDDRFACASSDCPVGSQCRRVALKPPTT